MRKCDWCKHSSECSGSKKENCITNDWSNYSPESANSSNEIDANDLISEILKEPTWLDGTCLVVSRDAVIDVIERMKGR